MRYFVVVLAFAIFLGTLPSTLTAQPVAADKLIALRNVSIVDVRSGAITPGQTMLIHGDRIVAIEPVKVARIPGEAQIIDGSGLFVIPGLCDMHVHLVFGDWFPGGKQISPPLFIANGVTSVRDMGSDLKELQAWRTGIGAGRLVGPRIYTSGPMLDGPKPRFPSSVAIVTAEDGRRAVDDLQRQGVDFIKFQSLIPRDAVFAIADEANKKGIRFEGHVPDSVRASEMSDAGMKSFEHLIGIFEGSSPKEDEFLKGGKTLSKFLATYDAGRAATLADKLAKNQTWQCPTLVWERGGNFQDVADYSGDTRAKYVPAAWRDVTWKRFTDEIRQGYGGDTLEVRTRFVAKELEMVQLLHRKGVPFLAGTDTPAGVYIFPGFSLHEELQRFVAAGFTPLEALQTATLNPARFFGVESEFGTVETGKAADLVLLTANPLTGIENTQKIAGVMAKGQYFSRPELDAMLNQVASTARSQANNVN